ncbi:FtsP/CotA-like multicopper oxidase with cupredoxin domain [Peribacillus deserti]|uniref:FtsP/CotA-like multicopper oxidase with cupredoxin domain n=1 Tax=Peribacillus deserti TaxID=673318 RepID=A0ABS2QIU5_9BACI|nr:copper oxidase [Peribacillus deserti]MBM7693052.1 FtsP/CotA-like multicopper oxidase with cupredoxin domain [Peribacillus deserti]
MKRFFHIVAIPIRIVYNNFGDHDPNGRMYVLKENEKKVKKLVKENPFTPVELVQPLAIRANAGDIIKILFENKLEHAAGMHFQQVTYDVRKSDGTNSGLNPDTLAEPGCTINYHLRAETEGIAYFSDLGNPLSSEEGTNIHGLFGAIFIQRRGSTWTDPVTGGSINSGVFADIHHPFSPSFREYGWFFNDEPEQKDLTGNDPVDPMTGQSAESVHAVNYRAEPLGNRVRLIEAGVVGPGCDGEEVHHDSWVFGDPATPILRGYVGDPATVRLVHGGVKETHVFHYHVHQWLQEPTDVDSEIVDAQAISPQNFYNVSPLYGLGSLQGAIGDVIIHCHLYPHFMDGMWGINRIFDTLQDGSQCYPNGVPIKPLQPLPDRPAPPRPTKDKPGFPNFIPGKVGCKAPRPPLGIVGGRGLTELERNAAVPNARPGAVFAESCLGNPIVKEFNISIIEMPIQYNKQGWHDPKGRFFIKDEDIADVLSGKKEPEPLVIHTNAGRCNRINLTNRLPQVLDGDAFQLATRTYEAAPHVHFVKFDPLVADGANVGWNYDSSVLPGETIRVEWFSDAELKATFFHDHLFANSHQQHGVFGAVVIHSRFSQFFDPKTVEETDRGTQVTVDHPIIPSHRDYTLFIHDFALLFDKDGCPIERPQFPGSLDDPGVFGVNYKCEPLQFRLGKDCDPAYSFSSFVHGDPVTPILRAYEGDPIRIRLLDGAHEESHSFNLHGLRWKQERRDLDSRYVSHQHIGISESFTAETFVPRSGDYLYAYEDVEDVFNGCWGILRAYDQLVDDLMPLSDRPLPPKRTRPLPKKGDPIPKRIVKLDPESRAMRLRKYDIVAIQTPILYNKFGDHDPHGIVFALSKDKDGILCGKVNPEPLVIRGNYGDLIQIKLTNLLDPKLFHNQKVHGYPVIKADAFYPTSPRISIHPQLVDYDIKHSSGDTVGFNPDQTVGPGDSITYFWEVPTGIGACNFWDMADLRNHRHHGSFGAFIAEPRGSKYFDPYSGSKLKSGANAVIINPFLPDFREFVIILHDGIRLLNKQNQLIIDPAEGILNGLEELFDTEDQGSRGFNYRTERLINRFEKHPVLKDWADSEVFGDPATPVFEAYPGDPVTVRLLTPADRRRTNTFVIHGHIWKDDWQDMNSEFRGAKGQNIAGEAFDAQLAGGAGGIGQFPGDYLYRSGNIRWNLELGLWGLIRVHDRLMEHLIPLDN